MAFVLKVASGVIVGGTALGLLQYGLGWNGIGDGSFTEELRAEFTFRMASLVVGAGLALTILIGAFFAS